MTTIHEYRREVRDYLRTGYGVTDIEELHGKHTKFRFAYNGRTILLPLNDRNGAGKSSASDMKLQDIRRMLGPPPLDPDAAPERPRRTLDELMAEIPEATPLADPVEEADPVPSPEPRRDALPARVAVYPSNKTLTMFLPERLVAEFYRAGGPRGVKVDFVAPDLWTVRHSPADRPSFREEGDCQKLQVGGAPTLERLGAFKATPAECWLEGGCLRVRLTEVPHRYGAPVKVISPAEKAFSKTIDDLDKMPGSEPEGGEATVPLAVPPAAEDLVSTDSSHVLEDARNMPFAAIQAHLRSLLEQVRALEAETPWRLERDAETGVLRWRAVMVVE